MAYATDAFADFIDLRTAVIEHVKDPGIADVFPRLLAIAESRLNRTLRMRAQITSATVTFVDGRAPIPTNLAEVIGLYDATGAEYVQQAAQDRSGRYYSIQGDELVTLAFAGDLTLDFYAMIPPLGTSITATNWLLSKYPEVYLYAVGFEAAKQTQNADLASATKALLDGAIAEAKADDMTARYSRARVRVYGVTP
jgi:hypothetical protein